MWPYSMHRHLGRGRQQVVHERASRAGCRRRRRRGPRSSAPPMPCTVPPAIWPSTTLGLIIGPQSSLDDVAQQRRPRRSRRRPRTCTTWVALAQIDRWLGGVARARLEAGRHARRQRRAARSTRSSAISAKRDADRRRAAHDRPAAGQLDVVDRRLEPVRGDGDDALAQDRAPSRDRAGDHRAAAAAAGARAEAA